MTIYLQIQGFIHGWICLHKANILALFIYIILYSISRKQQPERCDMSRSIIRQCALEIPMESLLSIVPCL